MKRILFWKAAILATTVVLAYGPVFKAGFIWDDDDYVTHNATLNNLSGLKQIWTVPGATPQYYPVTFTSFWIEHSAWGLNPVGYHVVNVLLHVANAFLVWRLLAGLGISGAWIAALLFGLHPIHVESVAWITERKNTLSAFFYLLAALAYFRSKPLGMAAHGRLNWRWYGLTMALFALALLSKTVTCSLPAALLLVQWWHARRLRSSDVLPLLPLFALGAVAAMITVKMEHHVVLAVGADWDFSFLQRLLIASKALWFYAAKLIAPIGLCFIYPRTLPMPGNLLAWTAPLGLIAVFVLLWRRRSTWGCGTLTAVLFFAGTLFPALGFINIYPMRYTFVADHYAYLATIGPFALVGAFAAQWGTWIRPVFLRNVGLMALSAMLATLTWQHARVFHDPETLWRATIAQNPTAWMAHNNLGLLLYQRKDMEEAVTHYQEAYRIKPDAPEVLTNLGNWQADLGNLAQAEAWHRKALASREDFPTAWYNLGNVLADRGLLSDAETAYRRALQLRPAYPEALSNLAKAYSRRGKREEALALYQRALQIEPHNAVTLNNIAHVLLQLNRFADSLKASDQAVALDAQIAVAHHNRALALQRLGRAAQATEAFAHAEKIDPNSVLLLVDYGTWSMQQKGYAEAVRLFERALESRPDSITLLYALGVAQAAQGQLVKALDLFDSVLKQDENFVPALNSAAWLVATHEGFDDTALLKAEDEANRAVTRSERRDASILSTLAAVHAARGNFTQAVALSDEALTLLRETSGAASRVADMEARRALYAAGKPYREDAASATTR